MTVDSRDLQLAVLKPASPSKHCSEEVPPSLTHPLSVEHPHVPRRWSSGCRPPTNTLPRLGSKTYNAKIISLFVAAAVRPPDMKARSRAAALLILRRAH